MGMPWPLPGCGEIVVEHLADQGVGERITPQADIFVA
jgi:hypothetical protein